MYDLNALRTAIIIDPDDLAARMAYADALSETENPQNEIMAEFIRLNLEYPKSNTNRRNSIIKRQNEILHSNYDSQHTFIGKMKGIISHRPTAIENGFPQYFNISLDDWLTLGPYAIRENPIKHLAFSDIRPFRIMETANAVILYRKYELIKNQFHNYVKSKKMRFKDRVNCHNYLKCQAIAWAKAQHILDLKKCMCTWCGQSESEITINDLECDFKNPIPQHYH